MAEEETNHKESFINVKSVIDITTETPDRRFLTIDSKKIFIRDKREFAFPDLQRMAARSRRIGRLLESEEEVDDETGNSVSDSLTRTVERMLVDANEIVAKLDDGMKLDIIGVFFMDLPNPASEET